MKVLQINKFFYPNGGSETYFFALSRALEEAGHEVIHFSMKDPRNLPSPYEPYFIDHIDFRGKKTVGKALHYISSSEAAKNVARLVSDTKPDIAHVHNIAHQLTPSILTTLRKMGVPVVQTLHDYQLICPNYQLYTQNETCERCMRHQYWNAVTHRCVQDSYTASALAAVEMIYHNVLKKSYAQGVRQFIAPSQFLYDRLITWGWKESHVKYIPHFVEKTPLPTIKKKKQFLFVGRLTKEKGPQVLLEAARAIRDAEILFAGEGEERAALQRTITTEELTHCRLIGFQSGETLDRLVQESLAVVVPSLWYENAPMVVYESLALGTPVIASANGGLPELVRNGENGWTCTPGDSAALAECLRIALTAHPLQIPENQYNKGTHLERIVAVYAAAQR
jgi:glycosyltransferase involved in cell wall biosynthesis